MTHTVAVKHDPDHVCPACRAADPVHVFSAADLPINVGVFYDTEREALDAPKGRIALSYCRSCGLVHNRAFDPARDIFKPGYEVALHHSETFRTFIAGVVAKLTQRFDLKDKRIVEIGCGDAYFLRALAAAGNHCTGIDPTVAREGVVQVRSGSLRLIRDYFGSAYRHLDADFVCSLSVFEDIPQPGPFLSALHEMTLKSGAPIYFEVFNAWRAFEQREVWSVHYEQCNYFSLASLQNVFQQHGFHIDRAETCYAGDQYLFIEARPVTARLTVPKAEGDVPETLRVFQQTFSNRLNLWTERLNGFQRDGEKVVVWGTGGKGITFLNSLADVAGIRFVAEINPDKQGKFVPGTGQEIVPPEFLADYQPDKIIITNALYEKEMKHQARQMGVGAEFLIA